MQFLLKNVIHRRRYMKCLFLVGVVLVVLKVRMSKYGDDFKPVQSIHPITRTGTKFEIHLSHNDTQTSISKDRPGAIKYNATTLDRRENLDNTQSDKSKNGMAFHRMSECFKSTPDEINSIELHYRDDASSYKFECKHLMYLGYVNYGRTGNQLFQVAALLGTASYHGYTALVSSSMKIAELFNLPNVKRTTLKNVRDFEENICCAYDDRVEQLDHDTNWALKGFFQSWRYFKGIEAVIKREFTIKEKFANEARRLFNATVSPVTVKVSIHIRRGDFLKLHELGYSVAPVGYIQNAMNYFRNKYKPVHFFVVSDDKAWCEKNMNWPNVTMSPFSTEGHDMALMIESDHVIMTSGTFGWWGAWLCGGETVYWADYMSNRTSPVGSQFNATDCYPGHWIGLR